MQTGVCISICLVMTMLMLFQTGLSLMQTYDSSKNITSRLVMTSNMTFPYTLFSEKVSKLYFDYNFIETNNTVSSDGWLIVASIQDSKIARITVFTEFYIKLANPAGIIDVSVEGKLPGRTTLHFHCSDWVEKAPENLSREKKYSQNSWELFVEREERAIDVAFNVVIILLVVLTNIGMGAKVDLAVVKEQFRRPLAPAIGLCSQFIIMPLIAFTIAYNLDLDPGVALGLFALGCAPGGSASNAYTFLLDGNVSLSVTMTLVSTVASLGLLPLWLFTLGRVVYSQAKVKIPFENIFLSLVGIVVPVVVGIILQRKFPKVASLFISAVKYVMAMFILFVLTVGVYANVYIFYLISGEVMLAAASLPYLGFALGGLAAFIARQDLSNIITIAVETGIQNTGIPIILLRMSLQGPDKDTSIVAPVASAIFTPIPLIVGILYVQIRKYVLQRNRTRVSPPGECNGGDKERHSNMKESVDYSLISENNEGLTENNDRLLQTKMTSELSFDRSHVSA